MPRFYFHLSNGTLIRDATGVELAHYDDALCYAEQSARDFAALIDWPYDHQGPLGEIIVTNDAGEEIFRVPLRRHN